MSELKPLPNCTNCDTPLNAGGKVIRGPGAANVTINMSNTVIRCRKCGTNNIVNGTFSAA